MEPTQRESHTIRVSSTNHQGEPESIFRGRRIIQALPARGGEADAYVIEENGQKRFLKVYRKGITPKVDTLRRVEKISQQNGNHLVMIFEIGYDPGTGRYFEVTEYIEHGSLRSHLHTLRERVDTVIDQIAKGLDTLHRNGIVHRDLKPTNVMVRRLDPLDLVIIDFGIASTLSDDFSKIHTTSFKGTYAYMAPEELSGYFGKEIDWWHLGIIIYEILLGENPFAGISHQMVIHRLVSQGVKIPTDIPEKYQRILKGLLTRNYKKRWGYGEVVNWLEGRDVPVYYEENESFPYIAADQEWIEQGFSPKSKWVEIGKSLGLTPQETNEFVESDFTVYEVRKWVEAGIRSGRQAKRWKDAGFSPEEASVFDQAGLNPNLARHLIQRGITAFHIYKLIEGGISGEVIYHAVREQLEHFLIQGFSIDDARNFKAARFSPDEAKEWSTRGFSPYEAFVWKALGYSPEKAFQKQHKGITLDTLVKRKFKMTMSDMENWIKRGFHPVESARWKKKGFTPEEARAWKDVSFTPEESKRWRKAKFTPMEARQWCDKGLSVSEASRWRKAGFSAIDASHWKQHGFDLRSAKLWIKAGFTLNRASELRESGLSPARAWLYRILPPRVFRVSISHALGNFILSLLTGYFTFIIGKIYYTKVRYGHIWGMKVYTQAQNFFSLPKITTPLPSLDSLFVLLGSIGVASVISARTFNTKMWIPLPVFFSGILIQVLGGILAMLVPFIIKEEAAHISKILLNIFEHLGFMLMVSALWTFMLIPILNLANLILVILVKTSVGIMVMVVNLYLHFKRWP